MTDFKANMHQIRDPLAAFKGPTSKGRGGMKREGKGTEGKGRGKGRGEKGREGPHTNAGTWVPSYLATLLIKSKL